MIRALMLALCVVGLFPAPAAWAEYGDIIELGDQTLLLLGKPLALEREADVANVILHRAGDTLYLVDTGDGAEFREFLRQAVERLRPFRRLVLINTNGHADHIGNNDIIGEFGAEQVDHFISVKDIPTLRNNVKHFSHDFDQVAPYVDLGNSPEGYSRDLFALFGPLKPSIETVQPLESLPLESLEIGGEVFPGWRFGNEVQVLQTNGRTAGQVVVYFPRLDLLHLADESNSYYPLWHDSDPLNSIHLFTKLQQLLRTDALSMLTDSRHYRVFRDSQAQQALVDTLVANFFAFDRFVNTALTAAGSEGLTLEELADRFEDDPALKVGSDLDVDRNPLFVRIKLLKKLREVGAVSDDPANARSRFHRPVRMDQ